MPCHEGLASKQKQTTRMTKKIIYLAVPYTHADPAIRERRFNIVNKVAASLINKGLHIFSPISHSHPIALSGDLPKGIEFWLEFDRCFLEVSQKLIVLKLDGWEESKGVKAEIEIATELGIPIEYMEPEVCYFG